MVGKISTFVMVVLITLTVFFTLTFVISDANVSGEYIDVDEFKILNSTGQYTANIENQTKGMEETIRNSKSTGVNPLEGLNLLLQGGASAAVALIGMIALGFAIIFDLGGVLLIPAFFIGVAALALLFIIVAQIIEALRTGKM